MATFTGVSLQASLDDIIKRALRIIGADDQISAEEWTNARLSLHSISNSLVAMGAPLWKFTSNRISLPTSSQVVYSGTSYVCIEEHSATSSNRPDTNLGKNYWVVAGTSSDTWTSGTVYSTPREIDLGLGVIGVDKVSIMYKGSETIVTLVSKDEYENLNKVTTGEPTKAYFKQTYDNQQPFGTLFFYPTPYQSDYELLTTTINIPYHGANTSDYLDIPPQWFETLTHGLAASLSYEYGIEPDTIVILERKAKECYVNAKKSIFNDSIDRPIVISRFS